jgi:hypothetical protein
VPAACDFDFGEGEFALEFAHDLAGHGLPRTEPAGIVAIFQSADNPAAALRFGFFARLVEPGSLATNRLRPERSGTLRTAERRARV